MPGPRRGMSDRDGTVFCADETFDLGWDLERRVLGGKVWFLCGGGLGLSAEGGEALDGEHLLAENLTE